MSQIHVKSPKHCADKHTVLAGSRRFNKKLYLYFTTIFLLLLSLILLVWLILHPTKPHFSLTQADVNQLNLASPSLLNSSIQLTLQSTNPNKKVGIFYDEFHLYASYKRQKITPETSISPFYQGHEETTFLSASLAGVQLPVSPSFAYEIQRDTGTGKLVLNFKGNGRLRWKVGNWVSGRYRFMVDCVTVMPFGAIPSPPLSSRQGTVCSTTV
ncbi:NDR1/HIN1-like protein 26 [Primulina eburnea]|uniref:NDR1/HIN1-like protein 26 n=1 Tax=Primulina eburnea TaxID=1245227 RepID=UPI003C6CA99F